MDFLEENVFYCTKRLECVHTCVYPCTGLHLLSVLFVCSCIFIVCFCLCLLCYYGLGVWHVVCVFLFGALIIWFGSGE